MEPKKQKNYATGCAFLIAVVVLIILVFVLINTRNKNEKYARCVTPSNAQMVLINDSISYASNSVWLENSWAVKSEDYKNVYIVAGKLTWEGIKNGEYSTAVWAVGGDLDNPRNVASVEAIAHEFSIAPYMPDIEELGLGIFTKIDGVQIAIDCVSKKK